MVNVVNCKHDKFDVYIGRECYGYKASKWANPFIIKKDGSRSECIKKYETYLLNNDILMNSLHELVGKTLGCWCKPNKQCHGDVLKKYVERIENKI